MNADFLTKRADFYKKKCRSGIFLAFLIVVSVAANAGEPRFLEKVTKIEGNDMNAKVVGGYPTTTFPAVGALLKRSGGNFRFTCSGTLVGCRTFLTAAHCVCNPSTGTECNKYPPQKANFEIFFQHLGRFKLADIRWPDAYIQPNTATGSTADLAVLTLARPVSGVRPRLIGVTEAPPAQSGESGTIVGFGLDKGKDAGIKRYGGVRTASCRAGYAKDELICWNYRLTDGGQNSCKGDSGGPLFQSVAGQDGIITGVTSGGEKVDCSDGDHAFDAKIFANRAWLAANLPEANSDDPCGGDAPLEPGGEEARASRYSGATGEFAPDPAIDEFRYGFKIADVVLLRVTLNAADPFQGDVDLYLVPGRDQDDRTKAVCTKDDKENFAVCEVDPKGGEDWTMIVRRRQGTGMFQVTATIF
jgi:hypothetical protein